MNFDSGVPLHSRIADPTAEIVDAFTLMAGKTATAHQLNAAQLQRLTQELASLPPLHQYILKHHLRHFSFIATEGRGDFPGSPAPLTLVFVLADDRIAGLKIGA